MEIDLPIDLSDSFSRRFLRFLDMLFSYSTSLFFMCLSVFLSHLVSFITGLNDLCLCFCVFYLVSLISFQQVY